MGEGTGRLRCRVSEGVFLSADRPASARFPRALFGQPVVVRPGHFDVNVNPVQERSADPFLVTGDGLMGAGAFLDRIAEETARAGVKTKRTHYVIGCVRISMERLTSTSRHCKLATRTMPTQIGDCGQRERVHHTHDAYEAEQLLH